MLDLFELQAIAPGDRIWLSFVVSKLKHRWCPFVKRIGMCDEMCSANPFCVSNIQAIMDLGDSPRTPHALLQWKLKDQIAIRSEELEGAKLDRTQYGEVEKFSWDVFIRS